MWVDAEAIEIVGDAVNVHSLMDTCLKQLDNHQVVLVDGLWPFFVEVDLKQLVGDDGSMQVEFLLSSPTILPVFVFW